MYNRSGKAVLVIHGGAGVIRQSSMTAELDQQHRDALEEALRVGHDLLRKNASSLDVVEAAVRVLEDAPLFNAGKGAVFTRDGKVELDAAIMDGSTHRAGAVSGLNCMKNPISVARAVMERSSHVLLCGTGANQFAREVAAIVDLEIVDESYFWTSQRWKALEEFLQSEAAVGQGAVDSQVNLGTVGAVALDAAGNLAAATSTGGITGKRYGRTGDTPIIGAGTYADNNTCAISCTGQGEYMIRNVMAYDVAALIKYQGLSLQQAVEQALVTLDTSGGSGGLIALNARGEFAFGFNSEGMFRGCITAEGNSQVAIYS